LDYYLSLLRSLGDLVGGEREDRDNKTARAGSC